MLAPTALAFTHFSAMFPLYKHRKTFAFLVFSGVLEWEYWPKMGKSIILKVRVE